MVILLIFEVVMKAHHCLAWPYSERYPMMDEAKHRGIGF
jgi:hypothetical protein